MHIHALIDEEHVKNPCIKYNFFREITFKEKRNRNKIREI